MNGKPAIEWVMGGQVVSIDSASGITYDANCYALEMKANPRYPLDLLCRATTASMRMVEMLNGLLHLDMRDDG